MRSPTRPLHIAHRVRKRVKPTTSRPPAPAEPVEWPYTLLGEGIFPAHAPRAEAHIHSYRMRRPQIRLPFSQQTAEITVVKGHST